MNIDKKAAHYLRNSWIDFQTFYIFDIIPQNKDDAVIILAPLHPEEDHVFFVWYQGKRYQDACRSGQQLRGNGFTPQGDGSYSAAPAYAQPPKTDFLDIPDGVDDCPFN